MNKLFKTVSENNQNKKLQLLFISIDPKDEMEIMKKYVEYFNKDFIGTINVGGKKISDYDLYKKYKKNLKKCLYYDIQKKLNFKISKDASMNCSLLNKLMIKSNV